METVIENKFKNPFCIHTLLGSNTSLELKAQDSPRGEEIPQGTDAGEGKSETNLMSQTRPGGGFSLGVREGPNSSQWSQLAFFF